MSQHKKHKKHIKKSLTDANDLNTAVLEIFQSTIRQILKVIIFMLIILNEFRHLLKIKNKNALNFVIGNWKN